MKSGMDYAWSRPAVNQVDVVFRYLGTSGACLTLAEAAQLHALGKAIAPNFEQAADQAKRGFGQGETDAAYANTHADALGIPTDVAIWYSVDTGATGAEVRGYFQGLKAHGGRPVGIYGPLGAGLQMMQEGLASYVWVANAASWSGFRTWAGMAAAARASVAHVLQHLDHPLQGVPPNEYDYDEILRPFPAWGPSGTTTPQPQTKKGHKMFLLFKISDATTTASKAAVWVTDGVQRRWVQTAVERDALIFAAAAQGLPTNIAQMQDAQVASIAIVGPSPA